MTTTSNSVASTGALQLVHVQAPGADESLNQRIAGILESLGPDVKLQVVDDPATLIERLDRDHYDAIVVGHSRKQTDAIGALDYGLAFSAEYPVIVITDEDDEDLTQQILADGAVECLPAGMDPQQFERAVRRALARFHAAEKGHAPSRSPSSSRMIGAPLRPVTSSETVLVPSTAMLANPVHPDAMRRRSKTGALIGLALLVAVGIGAYRLWTAFFRFEAYGVVVGRTIDVSAPWDGQIKYVHVEEGQVVRQGDLLVTAEDLALRRELESLDDELAVANSELNAKVSELKWNASYFHDINARTSTAFYETWGQLLHEREMVTKLKAAFARAQVLIDKKAITRDDYDKVKYELRGRIHKVRKLTQAVEELRRQVDSAEGLTDLGTDQLAPLYARIAAIKGRRERLRAQIAEGQLRAPVNGIVLRRNGFAGEHCEAGQPILSVIEEASTRIIVYYSQSSRRIPRVGDTVTVQMPPHGTELACVVERVGESYEPAPKQIARHYLSEERLLPVRMRPVDVVPNENLRLDAVVMLPKLHSALLSWAL